MWELMFQPFVDFGFMRRALLGCVAVSVGATPLGVFLLLRRMSLTGDAMAHAILPGAAVGYLVSGLSLGAMTIGGQIAGMAVALLSGYDRLAEAAEFDGELVVTTAGIETISLQEHGDDEHDDDDEKQHDDEQAESKDDNDGEEHDDHHNGEFDPHGWQSLQNAIVYVDNITAALAKTSPSNASTFYENRAAYVEEIESLDREIRNMIALLPSSERTIVTSHDAFQYFGRDYGLTFLAPQGLSTESEASARDVAQLINQIRAERISAVFVENVADPRLVQQIATETGSIVGGKLFPGALSSEDGSAATYLDMMRHNATTIATALTEAKKP